MRRLLLLSSLIYGLLLFGLATLNGGLIALAIPLAIYLGASLFYGPERPKLRVTRTLSADRVPQDAPVVVKLAIVNEGPRLELVSIKDPLPVVEAGFALRSLELVDGEPRMLTSLVSGGTVELEYTVRGKRGIFRFQDVQVTASDGLGLFRRHTYEAARESLFLGNRPEGYAEVLSEMENKVDSMDSAIELLDAKSALDEVYPKAKGYFEKMDRLFENLVQRAKKIAAVLANKKVVDAEEIHQAIENALPEKVLFLELRKAFRSSKELLSLRSAFTEMNRWLRNQEIVSSEAAFRPYLNHKVLQAFADRMPKAEEGASAIPPQENSSKQERQIPPPP